MNKFGYKARSCCLGYCYLIFNIVMYYYSNNKDTTIIQSEELNNKITVGTIWRMADDAPPTVDY